jgi:hypothetical protein
MKRTLETVCSVALALCLGYIVGHHHGKALGRRELWSDIHYDIKTECFVYAPSPNVRLRLGNTTVNAIPLNP